MVRAEEQTPGRLRRTEHKRAVILDAAEALFVSAGYELTGVDAIAARAGVSKRTVYDHFGDKRSLFHAVLVRVNEALATAVRAAIDEEITDGRDLRAALTAFALRVATRTFPSSEYAAFRRLTTHDRTAPRLAVPDYPERMLEERFTRLAADGAMAEANPRRAVQHFTALTLLLALDAAKDDPGEPEIRAIIADGVDVFLRAYGPARR
ncbi:TetR/AcrR family transcriptional regulator [Actinokineospora sp. UTMC 2448]|uniref:TetR/AcrR family transcriptional regulator n=1 Tax=Actinokineospora sp. UTMC 2448 TaxID=2268449 RepID=UPI002164078E|nr:TetR/AcrR family transcriptional regulator [Actinokineospora sp. UTMC 2448]